MSLKINKVNERDWKKVLEGYKKWELNGYIGGMSLTYAYEQNNGGLRSTIAARGISFTEAALFVNFLNTVQGFSPAYKILSAGGSATTTTGVQVWGPGDTGYSAMIHP